MLNFILNPVSSSSSGESVWAVARRILNQRCIDYKVHVTEYPGHASELARRISTSDPFAQIIVVGGDGSLHEVLNGLQNLNTITLGLLPAGSGNDFARGMGISKNTETALTAILEKKHIVAMDIGLIGTKTHSQRFCVSAGMGFDASVCHAFDSSGIKKKLNNFKLGSLAYSLLAVQQSFTFDPCTVRVTTDGGREFSFPKVMFAAIMNQKFEGGGCMMAPHADPCDGVLDIFVVTGLPKPAMLAALPLTKIGAHTKVPGAHFLKCKKAVIQSKNPLPVHLDGESGGVQKCISVGLENEKLHVITG